MKLHQLRSFDAVVRHELNLTRAAQALHATQPGVTKHIQLLEADLGVELFVRHKKRFVALTPAGRAILPLATRAVSVLEELRRTARGFSALQDVLTIATSPTQARSLLPGIIQQFSQRYPRTQLHLVQGSVTQSIGLVTRGDADFCLCSLPTVPCEQLEFFPCYEHQWVLLVPDAHALLRVEKLRLADIAQYPIITYEEGFSSRTLIMDRFRAQGLAPNVVLDAADSDIMKKYVRSGVGIAIVGRPAFDATVDAGLAAIELGGLIPGTTIHLGLRQGEPPGEQALNFFRMFHPKLEEMLAELIRKVASTT